MSIKRSHEVVNLCDQAIELEPHRPKRFSTKPTRHVTINTTIDSSDEFRDWTMPSYTKALVVAEVVAASVMFSLQVCLMLDMRKSSDAVTVSDYLSGIYLVTTLIITYAAGVITWIVVREPSGCRVGSAVCLQATTIIPAFIVFVQSVSSLQPLFDEDEDVIDDLQSFHQEETSSRVIHVVTIPFAIIIASAAIVIIWLIARATKFCSSVWENKNQKAAAFEFESVSHSQSQHF